MPTARFADSDGDPSNGVQYDCAAVGHRAGAPDVIIPACADTPDARPCWRLEPDPGCTPASEAPPAAQSRRLIIDTDATPDTEVNVTLACAVRS
jgi:hypothetical protein